MTEMIRQQTPKELKAVLRREAIAQRAALDPLWRAHASTAICRHLLALPEMAAARAVALFCSFNHEINTYPLLARLIRAKGSVLLPITLMKERRLDFRRVNDFRHGFVLTKKGIREPDPAIYPEVVDTEDMDLIIVPGQLYDRRGYRIGFGGAFYDGLLARPRTCRAIGIIFSPLLTDTPLILEPWDRHVDAICTEEGIMDIEVS